MILKLSQHAREYPSLTMGDHNHLCQMITWCPVPQACHSAPATLEWNPAVIDTNQDHSLGVLVKDCKSAAFEEAFD
jgi:hypothetical protein